MKKYQFRVYEKDLEDYLDIQSNISDFLRDLVNNYRTGKLTQSNISDIELQITEEKFKSLKNKNELHNLHKRKLNADTQIRERELSYYNSFNSKPSRQAESAIKKGIETRGLTDQEYENVNRYITVKKIPKGLYPDWEGKCDFCKEGEIYGTLKELKDDMVRHLTTEHSKKVMIL